MEEKLEKEVKKLKRARTVASVVLIVEVIILVIIIGNIFIESNESRSSFLREIETYNSEFIKYEGTQNGSTVRALCYTVLSHNSTNSDDLEKQIILIEGTATDGNDVVAGTTFEDISTQKLNISSGKRYIITFGYSSSGLIKTIGYTEKIDE